MPDCCRTDEGGTEEGAISNTSGTVDQYTWNTVSILRYYFTDTIQTLLSSDYLIPNPYSPITNSISGGKKVQNVPKRGKNARLVLPQSSYSSILNLPLVTG